MEKTLGLKGQPTSKWYGTNPTVVAVLSMEPIEEATSAADLSSYEVWTRVRGACLYRRRNVYAHGVLSIFRQGDLDVLNVRMET